MTKGRLGVGALLALALCAAGALWIDLASGAEGPTTITKCTTKAIEGAVEKGGSYTLKCIEGPNTIEVPVPKKNPTGGLSPGFKIGAKTSVTFTAYPGTLPTFENGSDRSSRVFTVASGGSLTLNGVVMSSTAAGPLGISAGKAKTNGNKGEKGEYGEEPEEVEEGKEELAEDGNEPPEGTNYSGDETSSSGGDGGNGGSGGFIAGKALNAPTVEGGAISNAGTLTLEKDEFQGDFVEGGSGGTGGGGGPGGAGGAGGSAGIGSNEQECGQKGEGTVSYLATPPGAGGDGGRGGDGGPGTEAGNGGEAKGGAVYNSGTLVVKESTFKFDSAQGGLGGSGGGGGTGGNGGNGGLGNAAGEGGAGGNGAPGGKAGNGASGRGGAIYNSGKASIENSTFTEDTAEGGVGGGGGDAGGAGKGGSAGLDEPYNVCKSEHLELKVPAGSDGGEGGQGAEGGEGGSGGNAEGGAIYNVGSLTFAGTNIVKDNFVTAGAGATVEQCLSGGFCPGKGSEAGDGGEAGDGEPAGSAGNPGPGSGANGKAGFNGAALSEGVFGAYSGTAPEEEGSLPGSNPKGGNPGPGTTSKSGGGKGGGGDEEDDKDEAKVADTGKPSTKENDHKVTVETGETVACPSGGAVCKAEVEVTISEEMPAEASSVHRKHKKAKPKALVIGRATITVAPGHSTKIVVTLTKKGVTDLRKHHRLTAHVTVTITEAGKAPVKHTKALVIQAPKPIHKKHK